MASMEGGRPNETAQSRTPAHSSASSFSITELRNRETGELSIRGAKGRKDRLAYATNGATDALGDWIEVRRGDSGPLFAGSTKARITIRRLTDQAVLQILRKRATHAGVSSFSPHDLRRSFISVLLDVGADISTVQKLDLPSIISTSDN
jgi:site-specific recombinase XerD